MNPQVILRTAIYKSWRSSFNAEILERLCDLDPHYIQEWSEQTYI